VGRRITGHFHRPLEDLEIAIARPRDEEDRRGIAGFQILAIRLPQAPVPQVVGAYVAELASRPGRAVSASDIPLETDRSRSALALRVESSYAVWTDEAMFFFSVDERRIEEMLEASPQQTPIVDFSELPLATLSRLDVPEARRRLPDVVTSRPSVPPDPELEQLLPSEVAGRPLTLHGSMSSLGDGVDQLTWPAGLIAQHLGWSTTDASAAFAAPSDGQWPVVVIRFKGLTGEEMEVILLAEWFAYSWIPTTFSGREVEGQRFTSDGGSALFGRGDVLYWVSIYYGASAGPDIPGYTEDVIRALP
jgi:hypothetical protein